MNSALSRNWVKIIALLAWGGFEFVLLVIVFVTISSSFSTFGWVMFFSMVALVLVRAWVNLSSRTRFCTALVLLVMDCVLMSSRYVLSCSIPCVSRSSKPCSIFCASANSEIDLRISGLIPTSDIFFCNSTCNLRSSPLVKSIELQRFMPFMRVSLSFLMWVRIDCTSLYSVGKSQSTYSISTSCT